MANLAVQAGDVLAFYGQGIPVDTGSGDRRFALSGTIQPLQDTNITLGSADYPDLPPGAHLLLRCAGARPVGAMNTVITGGIRKFVNELPGLGAGAANNLGQYIPVAVPDTTTYPGNDYYIIELVEYTEQMHSDLPPTTLRGYRQAGGPANYLGPAIVAPKDRPVRILFRNLLPTGAGGNLFIPVDSTVMGSGPTPAGHEWMMMNPDQVDPQNPMCSGPGKDALVAQGLCFADSRAIVHLHGGISPWISDGTPHQWITPAGETTDYPQGTSVRPVPDMSDTGNATDGEMTFYYTNQQSARLMFYHDHAWGITRLNVYAGMAAPYIIQDATEQALVDEGIIPGPAEHDPAGRPGQDLCSQRCAARPAGRDLGHRAAAGAARAACGCRMSTRRRRTRATPRASTSSAAGPMAPGSGRPQTPSITVRSTTPTTTRPVTPTSGGASRR